MPGQQYAQAVPQTEQFARSQVQQYPSQQNVQPRAQLPAQQFARPQVQPRFQRGLSQQYRYALGQFQRAQPPQLSGEGAIAQQSATPQQQLAQQPGLTASGVQQPVPSMGAGGIPQQPAMDLSQQPVAGIPQQSPVGTAGPAATNVPQQPAMGPAQQVPGGQPVQQFPTRGLRLPSLSAEDIIRTDVVTASADASISSIASDMADYGVGSVVIVEDEVPIGLITDREIALSIKNMPDLSDRTVGEVIDERIVTGSMDMSLFDLLDLMSAEAVRRIPIVDDAGRLQGIIALDDVLVLLEQKLGQATEVVKAQIPEA
jgi:CBS domain-containing protein